MFDRKIFATRLHLVRQSKNQLMKDIAGVLGVKISMVSMLESGDRSPSIEALVLLSEHFNVSTDYLLGLSDDPTPFQKDGAS